VRDAELSSSSAGSRCSVDDGLMSLRWLGARM
jgi:hypothetical protein